jgi:hypothetical protein
VTTTPLPYLTPGQMKTIEEKFAKEMAQLIFELRIEGWSLYDTSDEDYSVAFLEGIINDPVHSKKIKKKIANDVLKEVINNPNHYLKNGEYQYKPDLMDCGFIIEQYCAAQYKKL